MVVVARLGEKSRGEKDLMLFPTEGASFCQPSSSSSGLTQNGRAASAHYDGLSVTENCGDLVASWALNIHEVGVGVLDQALQLMLPLLLDRLGVKKVFRERHFLS